jgi:transglutaminase-like putative cysteine protease
LDVDPTNNQTPSLRHVTVAWGRDYGDVCPVKGVVLGGGQHLLTVAVDVAPLA